MCRPITLYVTMPLLSGFISVPNLCEDQLDLSRIGHFIRSQCVQSYNMPVLLMLTCRHAYMLIN